MTEKKSFAKGCAWGLLLVLPFWIAVGYLIWKLL